MFTRRTLLATAMVCISTAIRAEDQVDPVAFTTEICKRSAESYSQRSFDSSPTPVSPRIIAYGERLREGQHPIRGPILHLLFGPGVLPGTLVQIRESKLVSRTPSAAKVIVEMLIGGKPQSITFSLVANGSSWLIDDVDYVNADGIFPKSAG